MKHLLTVILVLILPFSMFSQEKEEAASEAIPSIVIGDDFYSNTPVIDTIYVNTGQPTVFLIDVIEYPASTSHEEFKKEEYELVTNFGKTAFQIKKIEQHSYIIFENKQTLDISVGSNSYNAIAYWSGNVDDSIQTKEGVNFATEFIAEQVDAKKESSYVINARKHKAYIAKLEQKDNRTPKSKEVMAAFLNLMLNPLMELDETHASLFTPQDSNLKHIKTYISKDDGTKSIIGSVDINKNGQPTTMIRYNKQGSENGKLSFIYEKGILTKMMKNDRTSPVYFDDNRIVIYENLGGAYEIKTVELENNKLLMNKYLLMKDDTSAHRNYVSEEKIEDNCVVKYFDNEVSTTNCSSAINKFPYLNKRISYDGTEIHSIRNSRLEKKDKNTFEIYNSNTYEESEKEDFKLWATLKLNNKKLLSSYSFIKRSTNTVVTFEYTYY